MAMNETLEAYRHSEFHLRELVEVVRRFVSRLAPRASDSRISTAPDERTLRYYQSLGLLGRPIRYDGRLAVYGYEHLLRAVAIKLLQSQGLSLAQVQSALAAASPTRLEAAIQHAERSGMPRDAPPAGDRPAMHSRMAAFALPSRLAVLADRPSLAAVPGAVRHLTAAELGPGVWVVIDPEQVTDVSQLLRRLADAIPQSTERS